jgi:predicted lipoprotein with Yx(FWY)xxD motif
MTRLTKSRAGGLAALLGVVLFVAACGSSSKKSTASSTPASTPAATSTPSSSSASGLTIATTKGSAGTYLVGASGRAIYVWAADSGGKSACSGQCAAVWAPVTAAGKPQLAKGLDAGDFKTIARADGKQQVTYYGRPLYYFSGDSTSGTTNGQGSNSFGAKWWLIASGGKLIKTAGSGSSSSSGGGYSSGGASSSGGSSTSSSGGGWG